MRENRYWQTPEQLHAAPAGTDPKQERDIPVDELLENALPSGRRDFLKMMGFGLSAAVLAACQKAPVKYALPYVKNPTDLVPGIPNFYATGFYDGQEFSSILVKTREGRPIKVEGNKLSPLHKGGVGARAHASILSLYDNSDARLRQPAEANGDQFVPVAWDKLDGTVPGKLAEAANAGKPIYLITGSVISPMRMAAIAAFKAKYPTAQHVVYDAINYDAIAQAHETLLGKRAMPAYRFDKAQVVASFNCDFLGTWLSPTEFTRQWTSTRKVTDTNPTVSRLYQFEAQMSLTGANADHRIPMKPSQEAAALVALYNSIAARARQDIYNAPKVELAGNFIEKASLDLWEARGKALVVSGTNDANIQQIVVAINWMLEAYGATLDLERPCLLRSRGDSTLEAALAGFAGAGAVLIHGGTNPAYSHPTAEAFTSALAKVPLRISFSSYLDDTAALCTHVAPDHHYLESWGDAQPYAGQYFLQQPTIQPLFKTRQFEETLLLWAGVKTTAFDFLRAQFAQAHKALADKKDAPSVDQLWMQSLHDGFYVHPSDGKSADAPKLAASVAPAVAAATQAIKPAELEVVLYQKVAIGDGTLTNNPWLHELPDPISKAVWDNYVAVNPVDAQAKGIKTGTHVKVTLGSYSVELPAYVQPGQARGTVAIALGYGRTKGGKVVEYSGKGLGKNAYPFVTLAGGLPRYSATGASLELTGGFTELALSQRHPTSMGRDIIRETTLSEYRKNPKAANEHQVHIVQVFPQHPKNGHWWAMAIDLNACTGCGACVVSCVAENNIAVVGRNEVKRSREMHWLRIDRYYSTSPEALEKQDLKVMELPEEYPQVIFQPMLCQQCDNAPCETVCPVLATTHSSEGLNQMTYNRCIGTRYCANNCPYKVRRFNWLDYTGTDKLAQAQTGIHVEDRFKYNPTDSLGRLVLNPDVTVRARGVMEKCTFCVQRLQAAKLELKKTGAAPKDGDFETACSQSCPSGAIIFGDLNDPESQVAKAYAATRKYLALEEVKTLPKVAYMVKVRNPNDTANA